METSVGLVVCWRNQFERNKVVNFGEKWLSCDNVLYCNLRKDVEMEGRDYSFFLEQQFFRIIARRYNPHIICDDYVFENLDI